MIEFAELQALERALETYGRELEAYANEDMQEVLREATPKSKKSCVLSGSGLDY